jgi:MFS family permease
MATPQTAFGTRFSFRDVFASSDTLFRFSAILGLQMGQVFPAAFFGLMLPGVFREQGLALDMFWVFSLPAIPTLLRPLWAPLVDGTGSDRLGRRKSWFLPCTVFGAFAYLAMSLWAPDIGNLAPLITVLVFKSTIMTTQDIAIDGYMVDNLADHERAVGAAVMDIGRNVANFGSWAGIAWVYGAYGWDAACAVAALTLLTFSVPGILRPEPPKPALHDAPRPSLIRLFRRRDTRFTVPLVFGVSFTGALIPTLYIAYLVDMGFSVGDIGPRIFAPATLLGTLIGASFASWFINRFGYKRTIVTAAFLIVPTVIPIIWMGSLEKPTFLVVFLVTLNGVALPSLLQVAMAASRLKWASRSQAATDYTALIVVMTGAAALANAIGGVLAEHVGWFYYFIICGSLVALAAFTFYALFDTIERAVEERELNGG